MNRKPSAKYHLWISCHDGVVAIVIAGRGLYMQSTRPIPLSYLLVMDVLSQDLFAIFEPVNLTRDTDVKDKCEG